MTKAKRVYKQRPVTIEDVAREFTKDLPLSEQIVVSTFLVRAKQAAKKQQQEKGAASGVIDIQDWKRTENP